MTYDFGTLNLRSPRLKISRILHPELERIQQQLRAEQLPSSEEIDQASHDLNLYMQAIESEERIRDYYSLSSETSDYITFSFPECSSLLFGCAINNALHACYTISGVWDTEETASYKKLLDSLCENASIAELKILTVSYEEQMQWEKLCTENEKISFYVLENADGNS